MTKLTIGIKALNEERHIARTIESALAAAAPFDGEVLLADSGSTDDTLEIAARYPIRIVQFADVSERCCGAGAQLAFQAALGGDYFYLLDGDMVLDPGFLPAGIAHLKAHPKVAAVGGLVEEMHTSAYEFQIRAATVASDKNWLPGEVERLDCGGLYRADVIRQLGYFADRNLHAFEECDLAARLQAAGWRLNRIDRPAVKHYGHQTAGWPLLWRRFTSGYTSAPGEVLRGALGRSHLPIVLRQLGHIRNAALVIVWWALVAAVLLWPMPIAARLLGLLALIGAPAALLMLRRRSVTLGLYSLAAWNLSATALIAGFARARRRPEEPIAAISIAEPAPTAARTAAAIAS